LSQRIVKICTDLFTDVESHMIWCLYKCNQQRGWDQGESLKFRGCLCGRLQTSPFSDI
jgi:hypothetical protein